MDGLGPRLKQAREDKGVSLREIATATKISMTALEALERGDFSRLPGGIYSRSFLRAYAAHVDLDPEVVVTDFQTELSQQERDAARIRIRPAVTADDRAFLERQQRAIRVAKVVAAIVGVAVVSGLVWLAWFWWPRSAEADGAPPPPVIESRAPVTAPPPADDRPSTQPVAQTEPLTVAFEVTGDCWVVVTVDGLQVLQRVVTPGERQTFTANNEIRLDVGNAAAFSWTINSEEAASLGRGGERRQVTVTRENFQSLLR